MLENQVKAVIQKIATDFEVRKLERSSRPKDNEKKK